MSSESSGGEYLAPGTSIGPYVICAQLGEGSGSVVYDVASTLGNHYALKLSRAPRGAPPSRNWYRDERFTRNIECLEQLRGVRWVAQIEAHDRHPDPRVGRQYLVQELVRGGLTITDWARRTSPPLRKIVTVFAQLAEACGEMAKAGIQNRDLKPANILMTPDGEPRLIDFDCGTWPHAREVTVPLALAVPGTPAYRPPELCAALLEERQTGGKVPVSLTPAADLHALGVTFYRVLTGKHPFDLEKPSNEFLQDIAFIEPPPPAQLQPVPSGLNDVVMRMLKKDPTQRYRNGHQVARDLQALLGNGADEKIWSAPYVLGTTPPAAIVRAPHHLLRALLAVPMFRPRPALPAVPRPKPVWPRLGLAGLLLAAGLVLGLNLLLPVDAHHFTPPPPLAAPVAAAEEKGTITVSESAFQQRPTPTAVKGRRAKALALAGACGTLACAGVQVRTGDNAWLANCPAEARRTVRVFDMGWEGVARLHEGPNVKPHEWGCEVKDGPVEIFPGLRAGKVPEKSKLVGVIRTGADGASLRFDKLVLPDGKEYPICALAAETFEWGPGIDKVRDDDPNRVPASRLHAGFTYVTTEMLNIRLAH